MRIVVFAGDDPFLIPEHTKRFAAVLREAFGDIESFTFDGTNTDLATVLDELRSYGLMQSHKLVILDHADDFLANKGDGTSGRIGNRQGLERYAAEPVDHATLLLRAGTWRKSKLDDLVTKHGMILKVEPPNTATAVQWCIARASKRYGVEVKRDAATLLVERIGPELARLDVELSKLASFAGDAPVVTRAHVVDMVGLSREEQAWVIQEAILTGDTGHALRKLRELLTISRQSEVPITWAMCDLMRKLYSASRLRREGMPAATVAKQLRLWGPARDAVIQIAERHEPATLAHLLEAAMETDRRGKSGVGLPARSLEALIVQIADTISRSGASVA
ncbi:MAG: DNA polymerase III subunit delta [Phycisphaerales bacterium]|nr:DNA polymerase III subunit delta [Phycisphaerales bacterium]